jgi:hypothetical protein
MAAMAVSGRRGRKLDRALVVLEALVGAGVIAAVVGRSYGPASTIVFLVGSAFAAATGWFLFRMIASLGDETLDAPDPVRDQERERLEEEKYLLLQGIKEFEADAAIGKVDAGDYEHLRKSAEARAVEIIRKIKTEDEEWQGRAESLIKRRLGLDAPRPPPPAPSARPAPPDAAAPNDWGPAIDRVFDPRPVAFAVEGARTVCAGCGTGAEADAAFCVSCGRPKEAA